MSAPLFIDEAALEGRLDWSAVVAALDAGHALPKAEVDDLFLKRESQGLLNRAAMIEGLGIGLKTVTVFPENPSKTPPLPTVQGVFVLFDGESGATRAVIEGATITNWKTAADSVLGARYLARSDSRELVIAGSGKVARNLVAAYSAVFPGLSRIRIWSRTFANAKALADDMAAAGYPTEAADSLDDAAGSTDILATATTTSTPFLSGGMVRPGTHVDLIGAYRPDMREADDSLLQRGDLFVDSRETTLHHIGELKIPLEAGVIRESDVHGDLYDLRAGRAGRANAEAVTVFKNGGGAHLDLMVGDLMVRRAGA
jgi:ornithine cyclodeaminase